MRDVIQELCKMTSHSENQMRIIAIEAISNIFDHSQVTDVSACSYYFCFCYCFFCFKLLINGLVFDNALIIYLIKLQYVKTHHFYHPTQQVEPEALKHIESLTVDWFQLLLAHRNPIEFVVAICKQPFPQVKIAGYVLVRSTTLVFVLSLSYTQVIILPKNL